MKLVSQTALTQHALALLVRSFGVRVIKPSPVLKACSPLLEHKDKSVRDGAKELAVRAAFACPHSRLAVLIVTLMSLLLQVELTRWLGAAAVKRDFTDKMRDAQKKEVSAARAMHATGVA